MKNEVVDLIVDILAKLDCSDIPENEKVKTKLALNHFMGELNKIVDLEVVENLKKETEELVDDLRSKNFNREADSLEKKLESLSDDLTDKIEEDLSEIPER